MVDHMGELERLANDPAEIWRKPVLISPHMTQVMPRLAGSPPLKMRFERFLAFIVAYPWPERWRGLNVSRISRQFRISILQELWHGRNWLDQPTLNFLTLADVPGSQFSMLSSKVDRDAAQLRSENYALENMRVSDDDAGIALAFAQKMMDEATPNREKVFVGDFVMKPVPFKRIDERFDYDTLRLSIRSGGIFTTFQWGKLWHTHFFSAKSNVSLDIKSLAAQFGEALWIKVMQAAIWRDACVVKERFVTERERQAYTPKNRKKQESVIVLPRTVRHVDWSTDEERTGITHSLHSVRGHYRQLGEGQKATKAAHENADQYGWPDPPAGWTFVVPHLRGSGGDIPAEDVKRVVCKGLLTAKTVLG